MALDHWWHQHIVAFLYILGTSLFFSKWRPQGFQKTHILDCFSLPVYDVHEFGIGGNTKGTQYMHERQDNVHGDRYRSFYRPDGPDVRERGGDIGHNVEPQT